MQLQFNDIFKSSFLEQVNAISLLDMTITLILSFVLGLFIFFIYKKCYIGLMYSANFGLTLIAMTMITALLILAVTSNIVLSLGMVGALSIVRFRTAIKEPSDIAFLFWAIAAGIILAAGFIALAVIGSLFIGLIMLVFSGHKTIDKPYILVVNCDNEHTESQITKYLPKSILKSKTVSKNNIELNFEIRLKDNNTEFINDISKLNGVLNVVLVSYNGDYMS